MRIAIIEDNHAVASGLAHRLRDHGHAVDVVHDGNEADSFLASEGSDLIVLDINLPGMSGLDVLRNLRKRGVQTPVLLLTARTGAVSRVQGLDAGADDYLEKPFDMAELEARIRALSRRREAIIASISNIGHLQYDHAARVLRANGEVIALPRRELAALECLLERSGRLVPKSVLANHLYGIGADIDEKVVEVYISRLRKKLEPYGINIRVARGLGYMLDEEA